MSVVTEQRTPSPGSPPAYEAVRREFRRSRRAPESTRWTSRAIRHRLPRVSLDYALEILLTWRCDSARYDAGAVAWQARLAGYAPGLTLDEAARALAALGQLGGPSPERGAYALRALCRKHGLDEVAGVLDRWLERRQAYGGF
ncbi:MAG TPA: hypothetical protein VFL87_05245 [Thermoleophilaceae bacterium]|nr:hypothetical protein [Thermoleophilaceae bacterium]